MFLVHVWLPSQRVFCGIVSPLIPTHWNAKVQCNCFPWKKNAITVCAAVVAAVRASIKRDWARVTKNLVKLSGACPEWFRGCDPALSLADFEDMWAEGDDILCSVTEGQEGGEGRPCIPPKLELHFTLGHPVPAPVVAIPLSAVQSLEEGAGA